MEGTSSRRDSAVEWWDLSGDGDGRKRPRAEEQSPRRTSPQRKRHRHAGQSDVFDATALEPTTPERGLSGEKRPRWALALVKAILKQPYRKGQVEREQFKSIVRATMDRFVTQPHELGSLAQLPHPEDANDWVHPLGYRMWTERIREYVRSIQDELELELKLDWRAGDEVEGDGQEDLPPPGVLRWLMQCFAVAVDGEMTGQIRSFSDI